MPSAGDPLAQPSVPPAPVHPVVRRIRRLRRRVRAVRRAARYQVHAYWRSRPVRAGTVLYEAFAGSGMLDNPEALFRELLRTPDLAHLQHIWVLDTSDHRHPARQEFSGQGRAGGPSVRFVVRGTLAYLEALATSQYLVNNATFPAEFGKRPQQVYLNTWHGTPLKTMGYDMPNGALEAGNTLRNFVSADFLLSQNAFMTSQMYASAYRLQGHYQGTVIEEGYPRVDRQLLAGGERAALLDALAQHGLSIGGRRVVLYAPTWKGSTFSRPQDDAVDLLRAVDDLQGSLGDDWVVLLRTHQVVQQLTASYPELRRVLLPHDVPTNQLLGLASVLVTDYSSIFFDFLATGRPIVFYTPDAESYTETRGTYFADDELPGPVCTTTDAVAQAIRSPQLLPDAARRAAARDEWQQRFTPTEDGRSAARVIDVVFRGRRDGYRVRNLSAPDRTSILLYLGGMASNGITSSALNLLQALPADDFDVSVAYNRTNRRQFLDNQARIPASARQFSRTGGMNGSKAHQLERRLRQRRGQPSGHRDDPHQRVLWDDEWIRCFGSSRFDHVIDFSGYGPFWATLLLHSPPAHRAIWLHNDIVTEVDRLVRGKPRMRRSLPAVFALYPEFDALVAVSASLAEINRRSLERRLGWPPVIRAARNLIDPARDAARAAVDLFDLDEFTDADGVYEVPEWARRLRADDGTVWFVTVGRFSPEKNQARLVRSFAALQAERPEVRLLLVGFGSLRGELENLIAGLGLTGSAFVVGPLRNPYPVLRACDCFVLSSRYEGQPMVLLEAAMLSMPIVSVDFASVRDALPEPTIHVVAQDDEALTGGMRAFLAGAVPPSRLDPDSYNRDALAEFLDAVGIPARSADGQAAPTLVT